jgi:hypothetical protein
MSLLDAVIATEVIPPSGQGKAEQKARRRYSEVLSKNLAQEVAHGLREIGFTGVKPLRGGPGEKAFQGGLGPKRVDVSFADERHGLLLAVSVKTITTEPYGKNLKNRFYDLCPEGITLHLRFPYSVVCGLFCLPNAANEDVSPARKVSTFERARKLLSTISGRQEYTDPGEKFENVTMMLFQPVTEDPSQPPWLKLIDSLTNKEMSEAEYFEMIRQIYNRRNPHFAIGDDIIEFDGDDEGTG